MASEGLLDDVNSKEDTLIFAFTAIGQITRDRFLAPIAINTYAFGVYARFSQDSLNRRTSLGAESFILSIGPYAVSMDEYGDLLEARLALEKRGETLDYFDAPTIELR